MFTFEGVWKKKVVEADAEIQKLKLRILELESNKRYYVFQHLHLTYGLKLRRKLDEKRRLEPSE